MAKAQPTTKADASSEQSEDQAPATAGVDPAQSDPQPPEKPAYRCDARVLAAVTIGDTRYQPDEVIEGLPVAVAQAHSDSVDTHPDAVAYARTLGTTVHQFE